MVASSKKRRRDHDDDGCSKWPPSAAVRKPAGRRPSLPQPRPVRRQEQQQQQQRPPDRGLPRGRSQDAAPGPGSKRLRQDGDDSYNSSSDRKGQWPTAAPTRLVKTGNTGARKPTRPHGAREPLPHLPPAADQRVRPGLVCRLPGLRQPDVLRLHPPVSGLGRRPGRRALPDAARRRRPPADSSQHGRHGRRGRRRLRRQTRRRRLGRRTPPDGVQRMLRGTRPGRGTSSASAVCPLSRARPSRWKSAVGERGLAGCPAATATEPSLSGVFGCPAATAVAPSLSGWVYLGGNLWDVLGSRMHMSYVPGLHGFPFHPSTFIFPSSRKEAGGLHVWPCFVIALVVYGGYRRMNYALASQPWYQWTMEYCGKT